MKTSSVQTPDTSVSKTIRRRTPYHLKPEARQFQEDELWRDAADRMFPGDRLLTMRQIDEVDEALQTKKVAP